MWQWDEKYTLPFEPAPNYQHHHASIMAIYANSNGEPSRAHEEIQTLCKAQHDDGFIPGVMTWGDNELDIVGTDDVWMKHEPTSDAQSYSYLNVSTSPLLVSAIHHWYESTDNTDEELNALLPHLDAFLDWWKYERKYKHSSLVYIRHPLESVIPESSMQKAPLSRVSTSPNDYSVTRTLNDTLRLFMTKDMDSYGSSLSLFRQAANKSEQEIRDIVEYQLINPLTNALFVQACKDLSTLYESLGFEERAGKWSYEAKTISSSISVQLWKEDEQQFCGHDITAGSWITEGIDWVGTVFGEVPIYPQLTPLIQTINNGRTETGHGCCISDEHDTISPLFNWIVLTGLKKYNRDEDVNVLTDITSDLCENGKGQYFFGDGGVSNGIGMWAPTVSVCNLLQS